MLLTGDQPSRTMPTQYGGLSTSIVKFSLALPQAQAEDRMTAAPESCNEVRKMTDQQNTIVMEEVTDPEELAKARAQDERFDRNSAWLQAHIREVYSHYRGKCICVAGGELFVADTPEQVIAIAAAAHPEDDGRLIRCIPKEKMARIYAN